ncbi:MAG: YraN family protein [Planctomycetes bacterium]|nr:YraN family protein [Planctomycetota bacterium]
MAARFLRKNGYRILERNFHCTGGELDIVAFRDGIVAFVEVRARGIRATVDPLETVTREKQKRVLRAAQQYASLRQLHREDVVLRLDLVAVHKQEGLTPPRIEHIKDAFQLNSPT